MNSETQLPSWTENAVLLYGPRKSGTTLLQNLHDGSNELFVYPTELKIKNFLSTVWQAQPAAAEQYFKTSVIFNREYQNFDIDSYKSYAKGLQDAGINSLRELFQRDIYGVYKSSLHKPSHPKRWCAKEVGGTTGKIISFWRQLFFDGKVIMIVRDPLMVTRSVVLDRKRKGIRLGVRNLFKQTIDPMRVLRQQAELIDDKSFHFVTYEKLTENPSKTMRSICDYLSVEYDSVHEYPTEFGEKVVTTTSSKKTKEVFRSKKKWYNDLSLREKIIILFLSKLLSFGFFIKAKMTEKKYLPYSEVVNRIENR